MRRQRIWHKVLVMRRLLVLWLSATLLITGCKDPQANGASASPASQPTGEVRVKTDPDIQAAQTAINQINQGRACTTFTRNRLESTIDAVRPEYPKRQLLVKHGLVKVKHVKDDVAKLSWEVYTEADLNEADGKGVFIPDGNQTLYCFGRWVVTAAEPSQKFPAPAGQRLLLATVTLEDAPEWVTTDPAAKVLAEASIRNDPAFLSTVNAYDKLVAPSLTTPNPVPVLVPQE